MRTSLLIAIAALTAFLVDYGVAQVALRITGVPKDFPPFTLLPILSGVIGGFLFGSVAYAIIRASFVRPERVFLFVAVTALALSFSLPLRLSFTKSRRFAGATPAAQIALVLMHSVVASATTIALTRVIR
jgi:hypothetical protein